MSQLHRRDFLAVATDDYTQKGFGTCWRTMQSGESSGSQIGPRLEFINDDDRIVKAALAYSSSNIPTLTVTTQRLLTSPL